VGESQQLELAYTPHYASWLNRIEAQGLLDPALHRLAQPARTPGFHDASTAPFRTAVRCYEKLTFRARSGAREMGGAQLERATSCL
jgi:hypothetical protein